MGFVENEDRRPKTLWSKTKTHWSKMKTLWTKQRPTGLTRHLTPTLSRWLRMVLRNAGIDTDIFKAHSVRGASTIAAVNSNVPLDDVMKMADCSRASIFQKFYYKPIFKAIYAHS